MQDFIEALEARREQARLGGGKARIDSQHAKGKLTARERIEYLLDDPASAVEVGALAADGMYADEGGCPSAGGLTGSGSKAPPARHGAMPASAAMPRSNTTLRTSSRQKPAPRMSGPAFPWRKPSS